MTDHAEQVAVVTGGARGIGRAIAEAYARDGARVAILDRDGAGAQAAAAALCEHGATAAGFGADVADYAAVEAAVTAIERDLGPVSALVNNAGISPKHDGRRADCWTMDPAEWAAVVGVNFTGAFHMVRAVAPAMVERRKGTIVNMSSVAGKTFLDLVGVHYSATKAGIIGLTRHLAGELGPYGITVNALAPGRIDTPMMRGVSQDLNDAIVAETPLRRLGTPEEVAAACLFFTSPRASFVTGQVCDVAGGWMMS